MARHLEGYKGRYIGKGSTTFHRTQQTNSSRLTCNTLASQYSGTDIIDTC